MGCGDGRVVGDEECDDGNLEPNDGCSVNCKVETEAGWSCVRSETTKSRCYICGDGIRQANEECDDGARDPGDGCSEHCQVEAGYVCANVNAFGASVCQPQAEYKRILLATLQENE